MSKEIGINELPIYSPWPARLLGNKWRKPNRTTERVLAEYDKDKYSKLLSAWVNNVMSPSELARHGMDTELCPFSIQSKLYLGTQSTIQDIADKILIDAISPYIQSADTIIELGAGWGYNLFVLYPLWPDKQYIGGDVAPNAIELASHMAEVYPYPHTHFEVFNFTDSMWSIFDNIKDKAIVLTRHAIEQLPSARDTIAKLVKYKDKIEIVIHLEPLYELSPVDNLLGLLRRSYAEANDYNVDLLSAVKGKAKKKILTIDYDILGSNPLNPTSLLVWKP